MTLVKLMVQYLIPQARKAGVPLEFIPSEGIAYLCVLLDDGHIDTKTARASIAYQVEKAKEAYDFMKWAIQEVQQRAHV